MLGLATITVGRMRLSKMTSGHRPTEEWGGNQKPWQAAVGTPRAAIGWLAAFALLVGFALWQLPAPNGDLYQYRCFALAFWHGSAGALSVPQCLGRLPPGPFPAFHVLPREYPPLAIVPFSVPLLFGGASNMMLYVLAFNALTLTCLGATAWLLAQGAPPSSARPIAARLYLFWLALGATTIALVRYDAVPALVTVAAVTRARRGPSYAAYLLLAVGAMLKLYPVLLLLLLAAWDWRRRSHAGSSARRPSWLVGPMLAAFVMGGIQVAANALAHTSGVGWLGIQAGRPPQIESSAAGLLWLVEVASGRGAHVRAVSVEHALALTDPPGRLIADVTLALAVLGIAWAAWATATSRIPPLRGSAGALLALIAGAAIFSPQYLLLASPLLALAVAEPDDDKPTHSTHFGWVVLAWSLTCICTTTIYSAGYLLGWPLAAGFSLAPFMLLVVSRDLLVWSVAAMLVWSGGWTRAIQRAVAAGKAAALWRVRPLVSRGTRE
jgi:Glycosyltransferase family 87